MATLYDVDVRTINYHVKKIFSDSELQEDSVIRKFRITAADGKSYSTNHYSLEMIIAVGFKVNSERVVQFRKWVNQIAKDYTIKDWVMDDERLKIGGFVLTPEGKIVKSDVSDAKNYLSEQEMRSADDREILQDADKITTEIAKAKAETEFEKYRVIQDRLFMSVFDKYMLELKENAKKQSVKPVMLSFHVECVVFLSKVNK